MMEVVLEKMPDDPLAREHHRLASARAWDGLGGQLGGRPAGEGILHKLPGGLEAGDQLGRRAPERVLVIYVYQRGDVGVAFADDVVKPVGARGDDVSGDDAYRAQVRRGLQGKLVGR